MPTPTRAARCSARARRGAAAATRRPGSRTATRAKIAIGRAPARPFWGRERRPGRTRPRERRAGQQVAVGALRRRRQGRHGRGPGLRVVLRRALRRVPHLRDHQLALQHRLRLHERRRARPQRRATAASETHATRRRENVAIGAGGLRPGGRRVHRHHRGRPGPRRQRHAPGPVRLRRAHAHRRRLHRLGVLGAADDLGLRQAPVRRRTDGRPARPQPERRVHLGLRRPRGRRGLARHRDDAVADDGARAASAARSRRARAPRRRAPAARRPTAARRRCSAT